MSCYCFRCWNTFCRENLAFRKGISPDISSYYAVSVLFGMCDFFLLAVISQLIFNYGSDFLASLCTFSSFVMLDKGKVAVQRYSLLTAWLVCFTIEGRGLYVGDIFALYRFVS